LSALELLGMQDHYRESLHVLIPARRQVVNAPTDVVVHRTSGLGRGEVKPEQTPPCTMPVRSTIDAAQWAETDDEARAIVVSGYQQGLVVGTEIAEALDGALKVRRRALILQTAADAAVGCEAIPEREVVRLCRQFQLPPPSRQELRADAAGRKRYRDVFFAGWPVQVEVDGEPTTEARAWPADLRRQNELIIAGVRLLRFTSWMVRNQPGVVATQLRAALEAAGWSPKH
jgi:hypothetical protein